jgi:thiosulfate/3-mercaptopyruvate sulfurtransferase
LQGAVFVDLDRDLSGPQHDPAHGGRHPLPSVSAFAERLGQWGVTPESRVVLYDEQGGANAAARMWWMLRALGHRDVQVLDGGLQAALAAALPASSEPVARMPVAPYPASHWSLPLADIEQVEAARQDPKQLVLDVRSAVRYRGEQEPIDPIAGHIPGARNLPLTDNLGPDGRFKSAAALRTQYEQLLAGRSPRALVVHCGSGVTACHTLLGLARAGLDSASLYVGSWSEWSRQPQRPRSP